MTPVTKVPVVHDDHVQQASPGLMRRVQIMLRIVLVLFVQVLVCVMMLQEPVAVQMVLQAMLANDKIAKQVRTNSVQGMDDVVVCFI